MSKIQRLNLELKGLDEENQRIEEEIDSIKNTLKIIDADGKKQLFSNDPEDAQATIWALIVFNTWWKKYLQN